MKSERLFMQRTYAIYRHQKERAGSLPFTLEDFRTALRNFLTTRPLCRYCNCLVSIKNVSMDHRLPLSRGGALDLTNVDFICAPDNKAKGDMSEDEYATLLKYLDALEAKFSNFTLKKRVVNALKISQSFRQGAMRRARVGR